MEQNNTNFKQKGLRGRKKAMFEALCSTLNNISAAADKVGIGRNTHYRWLNDDLNYKYWCEEVQERRLDFYETALNRLVKNGNVAAVIFALKTLGKKRGFVETQEIQANVSNYNLERLQKIAEDLKNERENTKSDTDNDSGEANKELQEERKETSSTSD